MPLALYVHEVFGLGVQLLCGLGVLGLCGRGVSPLFGRGVHGVFVLVLAWLLPAAWPWPREVGF